MCRIIAIYILFLIFFTGCAAERINLSTHRPPEDLELKTKVIMLKNIDYDDFGRPIFNNVLEKRPAELGEQYTLLYQVNNKPVKSFDIAITGQEKIDAKNTIKVLYKWTGKGFGVGVNISMKILESAVGAGSAPIGVIAGVLIIVPPVAGGVAGFIVGLAKTTPESAQVIKGLILEKKETLISYTIYEYDEKERLKGMKMYSPSELPAELVKTEFFYKDDTTPYKAEVTSHPENKVRTIE